MKIKARVPLTLDKVNTVIMVSYNTYEPATYDEYLVTSIVVNADNDSDINSYIDDITGKGSLNKHFKKLVDNIIKMDDNTRAKILNNSIYPVTRIDKSNQYTYYKLFNISEFRGEIYDGCLQTYSEEELKKLLNIKGDVIKIEFEDKFEQKKDQYTIRMEDGHVTVGLKKNWLPLTHNQFNYCYETSSVDINKYKGVIKDSGEGDQWSELTPSYLDKLCSDHFCYYDENGNHASIGNDGLRITQIINIWGLYFYKYSMFEYNPKNAGMCQRVLEHLFRTEQLYEFDNKALLKLTQSVNSETQQQVVNYILDRRDDSNLANIGIKLLPKRKEGWGRNALLAMKKVYQQRDLTIFYKIDRDLDYSDEELSKIDNCILSPEDKKRVEEYKANRENKIGEINKKIGEITTSGIRERLKSIKADGDTKKLTKLLNKHIGHKKDGINAYSDNDLDKYLEEIRLLYSLYQKVEAKINSCP